MESFNGREVSTGDASHAQALNQHLYASAFGSPQNRGRAADTHPVEPHPTQPTKPVEPTHPVEPPKQQTHPVEPPSPPTHPVEPPTHPVEPPSHPQSNRPASPPAETFHPSKPQKQDSPPKTETHTPVVDRPVPEKPQTPILPPPEKSHTVPPAEPGRLAVPSEKHTPATQPAPARRAGELHIVYDHTYKSDEERRTIQHRVEHTQSKQDEKKHVSSASHEAKEHHQAAHTSHHAVHHSDLHHRTHHSQGEHHSTHHSTHHRESHHEGHHTSARRSDAHHSSTHHADSKHSTNHHVDASHKVSHDKHQVDKAHVVDKSQHVDKQKTVDVTTVHVDKKHIEEHTHFDLEFKWPETRSSEPSQPPIEPQHESAPVTPKAPEPTAKVTEPTKPAPVEAPSVVPAPPAEPTHVEKPAAHSLKPGDTNEVSTSISPGQVAVTLTHEHHIDPKTYYRASVNAGVAGDHVGLGNTNIMVGRHLFSPYDKDGNPTRGNLNIEGGLVLQSGHTYDFGKLPRFGDTAAVVGVNGYYQPSRDLTLYGAAQHATNPKQFDLQFGAIKDSGRFSFQLGGEVSKVDGYNTSHFLTPGISYRLNKNTSIYASGAVDLDGHKERSAAFTGFRFNF